MQKLRAFVVEDNATIREGLIEAMEVLADVEVVGFESEEGPALKWMLDRPNGCDVVLIDLFFGSGSGLGILSGLEKMRASGALVPWSVVVSNYTPREVRERCLQLGAAAVFDKSLDLDALMEWLRARGRAMWIGKPGGLGAPCSGPEARERKP